MRSSPACDPQQYGVYDLEDAFMLGWMGLAPDMTRRQLQTFADKVCRRYRVPFVRVCLPRKAHQYYGQYFGDQDPAAVRLYVRRGSTRTGRNIPTLLHELAHHIDDRRFTGRGASHGPRFVAIAMQLYDYYRIIPRAAFQHLAKRRGVKIARLRKKLA